MWSDPNAFEGDGLAKNWASTDDFHTESDRSSHPTSASKHDANIHDR
jgi:hypothetical protein